MKKLNKRVIYFFVFATLFTATAFATNHFFEVPDFLYGALMGFGFSLQIVALIKVREPRVVK